MMEVIMPVEDRVRENTEDDRNTWTRITWMCKI